MLLFYGFTTAVICSILVICKTEAVLKFEDLLVGQTKDSYDSTKPPNVDGGPVNVEIRVFVLSIKNVNEEKSSYEVDLFFHQIWTDDRLKIPANRSESSLVLPISWKSNLWIPDTYFKNAFDGKVTTILHQYSYMTLQNDSSIFMAARMSVSLGCDMDLSAYPHDNQHCDIKIMSLQYLASKVQLKWNKFKVTKNLFLAQHDVTNYEHSDCTVTYEIGTFSCLKGTITLSRRIGFYLINNYIPSVLIVIMSFVTFWVPSTAYPARVTLAVTSLLTIVTQQYRNALPSVSYVVALNVWMLFCVAFVFMSLLEYTWVISALRKEEKEKRRQEAIEKMNAKQTNGSAKSEALETVFQQSPDGVAIPRFTSPARLRTEGGSPDYWWKIRLFTKPTSEIIDRVCRFLFPLLFAIFCVIYFSCYVQK